MPFELQAELLRAAPAAGVSFEIEPVFNILHDLILINNSEHMSGLDPFIYDTARTLSPDRKHNNRLVMEGLHFAVMPVRSFASFEDYLSDLTATDPVILRDRLIERLSCPKPDALARGEEVVSPSVMLDKDGYINYLLSRWNASEIDVELESEAHDYFTDPPRMHALILYHLQTMWREVMRAEWNRVQPMLEEAVSAFRLQDFANTRPVEIARSVTGKELLPYLEEMITKSRHLTLVPSAHLGPYLAKSSVNDRLWLLFGAHLPEGVMSGSSALVRSELLVRLGALNDDNRLRILELLGKRDELCAQDIITLLDLSQPAASRHLKQLSATGYVRERRRDGNKCYSLNRDRLDETCEMMNRYLNKNG